VYGYPIDEAAHIAVDVVRTWLAVHETPSTVTFCTFNEESMTAITAQLAT